MNCLSSSFNSLWKGVKKGHEKLWKLFLEIMESHEIVWWKKNGNPVSNTMCKAMFPIQATYNCITNISKCYVIYCLSDLNCCNKNMLQTQKQITGWVVAVATFQVSATSPANRLSLPVLAVTLPVLAVTLPQIMFLAVFWEQICKSDMVHDISASPFRRRHYGAIVSVPAILAPGQHKYCLVSSLLAPAVLAPTVR